MSLVIFVWFSMLDAVMFSISSLAVSSITSPAMQPDKENVTIISIAKKAPFLLTTIQFVDLCRYTFYRHSIEIYKSGHYNAR